MVGTLGVADATDDTTVVDFSRNISPQRFYAHPPFLPSSHTPYAWRLHHTRDISFLPAFLWGLCYIWHG